MLTQYHSSVIHNWRVHFRSPLSTTKVPLYCHKMIGRWLIKHYRIVNIIIICIVLITILLMDTHISILGPLLPKVDMILNITLMKKSHHARRACSPLPRTCGQPTSIPCARLTPRVGAAATSAVNCPTMPPQVWPSWSSIDLLCNFKPFRYSACTPLLYRSWQV